MVFNITSSYEERKDYRVYRCLVDISLLINCFGGIYVEGYVCVHSVTSVVSDTL